jgi:hypothetical protein
MPLILRFPTPQGKVNLMRKIVNYTMFGTLLLEDNDGSIMGVVVT